MVMPEVKRPFGEVEMQMRDNIKMNVREVGCDAGDWIYLTQDRNVCALINFWVR